MSNPVESSIPNWVPEPARQRISALCKAPLGQDASGRALLDRLANYEAMKTDVWAKLPSGLKGIEASIIDWSFNAFIIFPRLRRPYPKTAAKWREYCKHIEKYPRLKLPADVSLQIVLLCEDISVFKTETESYWPRLWEGDKSITPDDVITLLEQLRRFYLRLDEENQNILASLPKVKRWNTNSAQKFFSEDLSARMRQTYGQPLDGVVAALTEVAFDLPQGVGAETIRGRRRLGRGPENSKRKSR
jgi:hypothetical protein